MLMIINSNNVTIVRKSQMSFIYMVLLKYVILR